MGEKPELKRQKNKMIFHACWCMLLTPAFKRQGQADLCQCQGQPSVHSEFQAIQSYTVKPHLKNYFFNQLKPVAVIGWSFGTVSAE